MGAPGGVKAQPLVYRQGGAGDRLFRESFAGTALGGGRARKKPEKRRGPCGESGVCDRLRARGIIGVRRLRLVALGCLWSSPYRSCARPRGGSRALL